MFRQNPDVVTKTWKCINVGTRIGITGPSNPRLSKIHRIWDLPSFCNGHDRGQYPGNLSIGGIWLIFISFLKAATDAIIRNGACAIKTVFGFIVWYKLSNRLIWKKLTSGYKINRGKKYKNTKRTVVSLRVNFSTSCESLYFYSLECFFGIFGLSILGTKMVKNIFF